MRIMHIGAQGSCRIYIGFHLLTFTLRQRPGGQQGRTEKTRQHEREPARMATVQTVQRGQEKEEENNRKGKQPGSNSPQHHDPQPGGYGQQPDPLLQAFVQEQPQGRQKGRGQV